MGLLNTILLSLAKIQKRIENEMFLIDKYLEITEKKRKFAAEPTIAAYA